MREALGLAPKAVRPRPRAQMDTHEMAELLRRGGGGVGSEGGEGGGGDESGAPGVEAPIRGLGFSA